MPELAEIVREHGAMVWRVAYRLLGDHADAADCYQETFLAALNEARPSEVRHWRSFVRRIAAARAMDQLRRRYRQRERTAANVDVESLSMFSPPPFAQTEADELTEQLRRALAAIPANEAAVFYLKHVEECSYDEIAAEQSIAVNSVGPLLQRAREHLKQQLARSLGISKEVP